MCHSNKESRKITGAGATCVWVLTTGMTYLHRATDPLTAKHIRLWDPIAGTSYSILDTSCKMREVGMVYNEDNVWANVQKLGTPWEMSWMISNTRSELLLCRVIASEAPSGPVEFFNEFLKVFDRQHCIKYQPGAVHCLLIWVFSGYFHGGFKILFYWL